MLWPASEFTSSVRTVLLVLFLRVSGVQLGPFNAERLEVCKKRKHHRKYLFARTSKDEGMLGNRSRLLQQPTNKSQLMLAKCHLYAKPRPTKGIVGIPRQVVGFDPDDLENLDAVRSPRSVLEQRSLSGIAIVVSQEKQARSKKSGLEPLLTSARFFVDSRSTTENAGLRMVASMQNAGDKTEPSCISPTAQSQPIWIVRNHRPFASPDSVEDHLHQVVPSDVGHHRPSPTGCNGSDSEMRTYSRESIFSTSPSTICSEDLPLNDFLSACFFCKCRLGLGKDIFMYRGDRAFCSPECRYQQIVVDECKEGESASADIRSKVSATKPAAAP